MPSRPRENVIGKRFGSIVILRREGPPGRLFVHRCDCGSEWSQSEPTGGTACRKCANAGSKPQRLAWAWKGIGKFQHRTTKKIEQEHAEAAED